jgi:acetyl-CoA synthetase
VESALVAHAAVNEAAVVGFPEPVKGQGLCCYVTLKQKYKESDGLVSDLRLQVRHHIGAFATPDIIVIAPGLPKTRSGKIMRRILRKVSGGIATVVVGHSYWGRRAVSHMLTAVHAWWPK